MTATAHIAELRTRAERSAAGKAVRQSVPLEAHAELVSAPDDPVDLLESQSGDRVANLVPVRYGRMLVSEFTFYRGAALLMAADLAGGPRTTIHAQLCGDAHLSNFGVFASPERRLVFDLNDFDETHPGPFEWDVKRLAASVEICGRDNGFSGKQRRGVVIAAVAGYRRAMADFAELSNLAVWYSHRAVDAAMAGLSAVDSKSGRKTLRETTEKARTRSNLGSLRKLTEVVDGRRQIVSQPPLIVPSRELDVDARQISDLEGWIEGLLAQYRETLMSDRRHLLEQYRFVDIAHKVVGVGSVGTRAWILLFTGIDDDDPLFLQAKQANASVLERFTEPSAYDNHGRRVVEGQRLMQAHSDITLGWQRTVPVDTPVDYYVRQLRDWKGSLELAGLDPATLAAYADLCGWNLARAHARSGDRVAISGYLGKSDKFDQALASFASAYADKNERDYHAIKTAADSGRVTAEYGL